MSGKYKAKKQMAQKAFILNLPKKYLLQISVFFPGSTSMRTKKRTEGKSLILGIYCNSGLFNKTVNKVVAHRKIFGLFCVLLLGLTLSVLHGHGITG